MLVSITANYNFNKIPLNGLNRPRKDGEIILYTPCFHKTTLTRPDGVEIFVINDVICSPARGGSSKIPESGFILSIQETHTLVNSFEIGKPLSIRTEINPLIDKTSAAKWNVLDYIVGGTPLLLHNNKRITDLETEQTLTTFLSDRHARTALGLLPNSNWLFVVVDKTEIFNGMTIHELTDLMTELGYIHALNLDGGGSSTMVLEGIIKNSPHGDEDEGANQKIVRRVSDALVMVAKNKCPVVFGILLMFQKLVFLKFPFFKYSQYNQHLNYL